MNFPWQENGYRTGAKTEEFDQIPPDGKDLDEFIASARKDIEPWLSAVFQAEHLNLLVGSGFTTSIAHAAKVQATGMGKVSFNVGYDDEIEAYASESAKKMGRGACNLEDKIRSALAVLCGLKVIDKKESKSLEEEINLKLSGFLKSLIKTEESIKNSGPNDREIAEAYLQSFLLSFASRAASRERLHIFTTNYDRLIEHGADLGGLRIVDRFVGALSPVFRSSRVEVDMHYNPPGIRGEPRFLEGVVRLTKLHGSLDWRYDPEAREIHREGIPFGASEEKAAFPETPVDTVMIYPNPAKDVETLAYPYAELFRDMAAALCRPNAVVVTYGYGFGDDHINRILLDMLTIPSTHMVIISYDADDRLKKFCTNASDAQISLLIGPHFADLENLVTHYLPKPALDTVTCRLTELLKRRPDETAVAVDEAPASSSGFGGIGAA